MATGTDQKLKLSEETRVQRLRTALLESENSICIQRARYVTQYMRTKEAQDAPPAVRRASALAHVLGNIDVQIRPDELIVGCMTSKRCGAILYPEFADTDLWDELPTISSRETNPFQITEDETRELSEEIFPFWHGQTVADHARRYCSSETPMALHDKQGLILLSKTAGISHFVHDMAKVLRLGYDGIIELCERKLSQADQGAHLDADALRSLPFYQAVKIACQAVIHFAARYAEEARRLATGKEDPYRKAELVEIARVCSRVPARPATSFREALQTLWFTQIALHQENYLQGICPGRMDQYLYSYYKQDVEKGTLTRAEAQELIECLWIKMSELVVVYDDKCTPFYSGLPTNQAVTVGGVDSRGRDATNELTYVMLEAMAHTRLRQPNFHVRLHRGTPQEFRDAVSQVVKGGGGMPALFNDEAIIPSWTRLGIAEADVRDYAIVGCTEPTVPGKTFGSPAGALVNLAICLELALNDGFSPILGERAGVHTGDPSTFQLAEDVIAAFEKQLSYLVEQTVDGLNALGLAHRDFHPSPLLSAMIDGCMEVGADCTEGGAVYNFTGLTGVGVADVADSLAAIDQLVFREKRLTLPELLDALRADFAGREQLREMLLNRAAKYGNDEEQVDGFVRRVSEMFCREVEKYQNTSYSSDGRYIAGMWSMTTHRGFGSFVGALPSGRKAREPLANGVAPGIGRERKGPTACLRSASRIDYRLMSNGCTLNQKFSPKAVAGEQGTRRLSSLIEAYFDMGGMQIQFNVIDRQTLLNAQEDPKKYPGLLVRIAGYSAYFADLTRQMQDEIIERTEQSF